MTTPRPRIPIVCAGQNSLHGDRLRFCFGQFARPFDSIFWSCPRPGARELRVTRGLFALRLVPIVPSFRANDFRQFGVEKDCARERSPRPAEIGLDGWRFTGDLAMREHKTERLLWRSRSRGDVAVPQNMYATILEEGSRGAKDKIDVPRDVTVFEILTPAVQQDRVLPTEEATVTKHDAIAIDANRQRL